MTHQQRAVTACIGLGLALACGGAPAEPTAPEQQPTAPAEPAATASPITFKELSPELRARFRTLKESIDTTTDDTSFEKHWIEADSIAHDLEAELSKRGNCEELSLEGLGKQVGMEVTCVYMGSTPYVMLPDWAGYAAKTKGEADDRFVSLMSLAYEGGREGGWAIWDVQKTDDQGCSALGTGNLLTVLRAVDAVDKGRFEAPTAVVRKAALNKLMSGYYCGVDGPGADEALKDEAKKILVEIKLSPDEKKALQELIPTLKSVEFAG